MYVRHKLQGSPCIGIYGHVMPLSEEGGGGEVWLHLTLRVTDVLQQCTSRRILK